MTAKGKPRRDIDNPEYRRLRAELLAEQPPCHWCKRATATTVDHVIEVDRGIDPLDTTNWVPACHQCNSRRGANYQARKKAATAQRRKNIQTTVFFENENQMPPSPSVISPLTALGSSETAETELVGRRYPRFQTITPEGLSLGEDVAAWARDFMRVDLLPWQRDLVSSIMTLDSSEDGGVNLWARSAYWSCARQNGKSVIGKAICGYWVTRMAERRGKPQTVILAAHNMKLATIMFREVGELLVEFFGAKKRDGNGKEEIEVRTSAGVSHWFLMANRENAARGFTADLVWIDEVQNFKSDVINRGFRPTMKTRNTLTAGGSPLLLLSGTAGTPNSDFQINYREQAIESIDRGEPSRQFLAEWSPPGAIPWTDRGGWMWANPSAPVLIGLDALEADFKTMKRQEFIQEDLNTFVAADNAWVDPDQWEACQTSAVMPPGGFLAVDSNVDEGQFVGVRAAQHDTGETQIEVAFIVKTEAEAWAAVTAAMADKALKLLVTPTLEIHTPPDLRPRMGIVGYKEIQKFTGLVHSMITARRLTHTGHQGLTEHVCRAVMVRTMGAVALTSTRSPGPIELCRAMVWAAAYASQPTAKRNSGAVAFAS